MKKKTDVKFAYILGGVIGGFMILTLKVWIGLFILNYFNWLPF